MESTTIPRVVIVGAGFGGLNLARRLRKAPVEVLLVDQNNYHTFQPLLYQVATAGLEPEEIAHAVRGIFQRQRNFRFRLGSVVTVDRERKEIWLADGDRIGYDFLVLAAGVVTNFYSVEGAREHGYELKSIEHALSLRSWVIERFERADQDPESIERGILNFVVVGGGPTGVEMSGALAELFHKVLGKDYPHLPMHRVRVILVEAAPQILGQYHPRLQQHAVKTLARRGVEVRRGEQVVRVSARAVHLKTGEVIPTETLIWTAGVRSNPLADALGLEQVAGGRIVVEPDLRAKGHADLFVIGDMAAGRDAAGRLHPQMAPVAIQGGRHVARQIEHLLAGRPTERFDYRDGGSMATIGRNSAVAEFPIGLKTSGFIAWLMWLALHLVQLIGFRNRLNVLINWVWNYFTYDRSARLIMARFADEGSEAPAAWDEGDEVAEQRLSARQSTPLGGRGDERRRVQPSSL